MRKDLTNLKIGEILVIKKIKHEKRVMWECQCSCGEIFYERTSRLNGSEKQKTECPTCSSILWTDAEIKYLIEKSGLEKELSQGVDIEERYGGMTPEEILASKIKMFETREAV